VNPPHGQENNGQGLVESGIALREKNDMGEAETRLALDETFEEQRGCHEVTLLVVGRFAGSVGRPGGGCSKTIYRELFRDKM